MAGLGRWRVIWGDRDSLPDLAQISASRFHESRLSQATGYRGPHEPFPFLPGRLRAPV
jgi:hypothetical protein